MKRRTQYIQILFCPPLTTDEHKRNRMDRKAARLNKKYRFYAYSIKEAWEKARAEQLKAEKKELGRLPGWETMGWIEDIRNKEEIKRQ